MRPDAIVVIDMANSVQSAWIDGLISFMIINLCKYTFCFYH